MKSLINKLDQYFKRYIAMSICIGVSSGLISAQSCTNGPIANIINTPLDTLCGTSGIFTLKASTSQASHKLYWYSDTNSTNILGIGDSLTTGTLTQSRNYWVQARSITAQVDNLGISSIPPTPGSTSSRGLVLNIVRPMRLLRAYYYSSKLNTINTVQVILVDHNTGVVVTSQQYNVTQGNAAGFYPLELDMDVPVGTYRLLASFSQEVHRMNSLPSGVSYPMPLDTFGQIVGAYSGTGVSTTSYNYFHNISIAQSVCLGPRVPARAELLSPNPIQLSEDSLAVCTGDTSIYIRVSAPISNSNYTYSWQTIPNFALAPIGDIKDSSRIYSQSSGIYRYILSATETRANGISCISRDSLIFNSLPKPESFTILPSSSTLACNSFLSPIVALSKLDRVAKIGNGQTASSIPGMTPLNTQWQDQKVQYLFTAQEMLANGFKAGPIDSIAFMIVSRNTTLTHLSHLEIRMGQTSDTVLSSYIEQPTQLVYSASGYQIPSGDTARFPFINSYLWDGLSSIVIEICKDHPTINGNISVETTVLNAPRTYGTYQDLTTNNLCAQGSQGINVYNLLLRPNTIFYQKKRNSITWTPASYLYLDSLGNIPYASGLDRDSLWIKHNDTIVYQITATHSNGCQIDSQIVVTIKDTITYQSQEPETIEKCVQESLVLNPKATSKSSITHQWKKWNGTAFVPIAGATADSLVIASLKMSDSGLYIRESSTGSPCISKYSDTIHLIMHDTLHIEVQPTTIGDTVWLCTGNSLHLNSLAKGQISSIWKKISNNTTSDYHIINSQDTTIDSVSKIDAGSYFVSYTMGGGCGIISSDTVHVIINDPIEIISAPISDTFCINSTITLSIQALNVKSYQWFQNQTLLTTNQTITSNSSTIVFPNASYSQIGDYIVALEPYPSCPHDTSGIAKITVKDSIRIINQPQDTTYLNEIDTLILTIQALNYDSIQWYKNDQPILGANDTSYQIINATQSDTGVYRAKLFSDTTCKITLWTNTAYVGPVRCPKLLSNIGNQAICENDTLKISVATEYVMRKEWYKVGNPQIISTQDTYNINKATLNQSGMYYATLIPNNSCKTTLNTDTFMITIDTAISITSFTYNPAMCIGDSQILKIASTGSHLQYQWYRNQMTTGRDTSTYSIVHNVEDSNRYHVVISSQNNICKAKSSDTVTIITNRPPTPPTVSGLNTPYCANDTIRLKANSTYHQAIKWVISNTSYSSDSITIIASPTRSDTLISVSALAKPGCKDTMIYLSYLVKEAPIVSISPMIQYVNNGQSVKLTASVSNPYDSIVWYYGSQRLSIGTEYQIANFDSTRHHGSYHARVYASNPCRGYVVSDTAQIIKTNCPIYTLQPTNTEVCIGSTATLSASAINTQSYQWYYKNKPIPGATSSTYTISQMADTLVGQYQVGALPKSNVVGCVETLSNTVNLTMVLPPRFTLQPVGPSSCSSPAATHTMTTAATSTKPVTYQWYLNGIAITGATSTSYTATGIGSSAKVYYVEAKNALCPATRSHSVIAQIIDAEKSVSAPTRNIPQMVAQCKQDGWIYFSDTANPNIFYLAIESDDPPSTFKPFIERNSIYTEPYDKESSQGAIFGRTLYNINRSNLPSSPYKVRLYYLASDENTHNARYVTRAPLEFYNPLQPRLSYFTSIDTTLNSALLQDIKTIPVNFDHEVITEYNKGVSPNNVRYAELSNLEHTKMGAVMYRSYINKSVSSIEPMNQTQILIYPNPVSDQLYIKMPQSIPSKVWIRLINSAGQTIYQGYHDTRTTQTINTSKLASGIYQIILSEADFQYTSKLVISR